MSDQLNAEFYFPCPIYSIDKKEFLSSVAEVSEENLLIARADHPLDDIYPVYMTGSFYNDPRLKEFSDYVGQTAWNILNEQGYDVSHYLLTFSEMWTQEHYRHSSMEQHVHGGGSQIVGFYFIETPEDCSRVLFHDPRAGKVQIDLPQKDISSATIASQMINFTPRPGLLMFAPAWMAHSFTRHGADTPIKFVHFNLYAQYSPPASCETCAEVI